MPQIWDIAIVGGGAAGLMAAITTARAARERDQPIRIGLLDGAMKLGAKILVAGGGRCNVTHKQINADDFAGGSRNTINRILRSFTVQKTVSFFADIGVALKTEETGKLFPVTDSARTVLNALIEAAQEAGVEILTECRVHGIAGVDDGFSLATSRGSMCAHRLIMATGGKSLPKTGSDGAGYEFVKALGHTVTPTTPALVPLVLESGHLITQLSGISADVELTVSQSSGKLIKRMGGAMLCTHFGISGPATLDISRYWIAAKLNGDTPMLCVNFLPNESFESVEKSLIAAAEHSKRQKIWQIVQSLSRMPERLGRKLIESQTKIHSGSTISQLTREQRRSLAHGLVQLELPVTGDRGYKFAEVTAGGVPLNEIDPSTMASRKCENLYLCGEILDADGRIGGFNFQWAWCTGKLAGMAAVR